MTKTPADTTDRAPDEPGGPAGPGGELRTSRAGFLAGALGLAGAVVAGGCGAAAGDERTAADPRAEAVPFDGEHQAGIATAAQAHGLFATFDLVEGAGVDGLGMVLHDWTRAARALTAGEEVPPRRTLAKGAPPDAGDGLGLAPARLTVTVGLGPGVFAKLAALRRRRPPALDALPRFAFDALEPAASGGDLLLQICADDPQIVSHAFRHLRPLVIGAATLRATQQGFLSRQPDGRAPRNLFGQHDGTTNPRAGTRAFDDAVWVRPGDGPPWTAGGTYLVVRKIRMDLPTWDQLPLREQERVLGRRRSDGAPLSGGGPDAPLDLDALEAPGRPLIADDAHVRAVHGFPMLRRSYNYDYGTLTADDAAMTAAPAPAAGGHDHASHDHDHGPGQGHGDGPGGHMAGHDRFDAGLLFAAYARDPRRQVVPAFRAMERGDAMHRFLRHTAGGVFFVPRGARRGGFVGEELLGGP